MLQVCLWQQGFATTDPGMGLTDTDIQMFDPGTEDRQGLMRGWAAAMEGRCDAACQVGTTSASSATANACKCMTQRLRDCENSLWPITHSQVMQVHDAAFATLTQAVFSIMQHPGSCLKTGGVQAFGWAGLCMCWISGAM